MTEAVTERNLDGEPDKHSKIQVAPGTEAVTERNLDGEPDKHSKIQVAPGTEAVTERSVDAGLAPAADLYP